jgi:hypothetical protein
MAFNFEQIPDYVLHDAVKETLGDCNLSGGTGTTPYNFRCPICGDSKKNPHIKRGYVLFKDSNWIYHCHNECGSMSFFKFLKERHNDVYRNVLFHAFDRSDWKKKTKKVIPKQEATFKGTNIYKFQKGELIGITDAHPTAKIALNYCISRKIPKSIYSHWYVCLKDSKFIVRGPDGNYIYNDKGIPIGNEYGNRLIIPYYRYGGDWVQFDARDLNEKSFLRYRNLEGADRELYNGDFLNVNEPFFLFEGSIDSTFVRNSVAFGGTKHLMSFLNQFPHIAEHAHNGTVIWDNDEAGYDEIPKTVDLGFKWFDWRDITPLSQYQYYTDENGVMKERKIKDMNDAVMYTNKFRLDNNGFIISDDLKKYIMVSEGASILLTLIHGNREKKRKQKLKKRYEQMRIQSKRTDEIRPYF